MDWNHDGKHDWQDHAFYNNVISDDAHKPATSGGGKGTSQKQPQYIVGKVTEKEERTFQIILLIIVGIIMFFKVMGD